MGAGYGPCRREAASASKRLVMLARLRRMLCAMNLLRGLESEIRQLNAALLASVVERERERAHAIIAAEQFAARVGMILPETSAGIAAGTLAHEFLQQATPRLCGLVADGKPTIH